MTLARKVELWITDESKKYDIYNVIEEYQIKAEESLEKICSKLVESICKSAQEKRNKLMLKSYLSFEIK